MDDPIDAMERIRSAAIQWNGEITEGPNHRSVLDQIQTPFDGGRPKGTACFVTTLGRFVSRQEAAPIALASGQALESENEGLGLSSSDMIRDFPLLDDSPPQEEKGFRPEDCL